MANDEDLARIRQGVAAWNEWRAKNPERLVDLGGAYLGETRKPFGGTPPYVAPLYLVAHSEADLWRVDLHEADLVNADLGGAYLREANLRRADLPEANLEGTNLVRTNLEGANLRMTNPASRSSLANLRHADLGGATLIETVFANVDLTAARSACT